MAMTLITVQVEDLKVGDEFIDHKESGDRFRVSWIGWGSQVEAFRSDDRDAENVCYFDIEDEVQIERYDNKVPA